MTQEEIRQIVRKFIRDNYLFESKKKLVDDESFVVSGVVDSTGILELISFLEERFSINFEGEELVGENFDSVSRVSAFLFSKMQVPTEGSTRRQS